MLTKGAHPTERERAEDTVGRLLDGVEDLTLDGPTLNTKRGPLGLASQVETLPPVRRFDRIG